MDMYKVFKKLNRLEKENKDLKEQLRILKNDRDYLLKQNIDLVYFVSDFQSLCRSNNIDYSSIINNTL